MRTGEIVGVLLLLAYVYYQRADLPFSERRRQRELREEQIAEHAAIRADCLRSAIAAYDRERADACGALGLPGASCALPALRERDLKALLRTRESACDAAFRAGIATPRPLESPAG
jgi:hypothetical protein